VVILLIAVQTRVCQSLVRAILVYSACMRVFHT